MRCLSLIAALVGILNGCAPPPSSQDKRGDTDAAAPPAVDGLQNRGPGKPDDDRPTEEGEGVLGYLTDVELDGIYTVPSSLDDLTPPELTCRTLGEDARACTVKGERSAVGHGALRGTCAGFARTAVSCYVKSPKSQAQIVAFDTGSFLELEAGKLVFQLELNELGFATATIDADKSNALQKIRPLPQRLVALRGAWDGACVANTGLSADCGGVARRQLHIEPVRLIESPTLALDAAGTSSETAAEIDAAALWSDAKRAAQCLVPGDGGVTRFMPGFTVGKERYDLDHSSPAAYADSIARFYADMPPAVQSGMLLLADTYSGKPPSCTAGDAAGTPYCAIVASGPYKGLTGGKVDNLQYLLVDALSDPESMFTLQADGALRPPTCEKRVPSKLASCIVSYDDEDFDTAPQSPYANFCNKLGSAFNSLRIELSRDGAEYHLADPTVITSMTQCPDEFADDDRVAPAGGQAFCTIVSEELNYLGLKLDAGGHAAVDPNALPLSPFQEVYESDLEAGFCTGAMTQATVKIPPGLTPEQAAAWAEGQEKSVLTATCRDEFVQLSAADQLAKMRAAPTEPARPVDGLCAAPASDAEADVATAAANCRAELAGLDEAQLIARVDAWDHDVVTLSDALCREPKYAAALAYALEARCMPTYVSLETCDLLEPDPECKARLTCSSEDFSQSCVDNRGRFIARMDGFVGLFDYREGDNGVFSLNRRVELSKTRQQVPPEPGAATNEPQYTDCRLGSVVIVNGALSDGKFAADYQEGQVTDCDVPRVSQSYLSTGSYGFAARP